MHMGVFVRLHAMQLLCMRALNHIECSVLHVRAASNIRVQHLHFEAPRTTDMQHYGDQGGQIIGVRLRM